MIKSFIFDFGNVMIRFNPSAMTAVYLSDPEDAALAEPVIFDREYWDRLDRGTITDEEVRAGIRSRLPERLAAPACEAYDNYIRNLPDIEGMRDLTRRIKAAGKGLYLLSNIGQSFVDNYRSIPSLASLLEPFDGLVFSAPLHLAKPDPAIFSYVLNTYSLKAEECLFVDDNEKNVTAAGKMGLHTYLFDGNAVRLSKTLGI